MFKSFSSAVMLLVLVFCVTPALAVQPYTRQVVQEESYEASSPVGSFSQYNHNTTAQSVNNYNNGQTASIVPVAYVNGQPVYAVDNSQQANTLLNPAVQQGAAGTKAVAPAQGTRVATPVNGSYPSAQNVHVYNSNTNATHQSIAVPQSYNKKIVTTEKVTDDRETIDKVLDRTGKAVGIMSVGGIVTTGIIKAFH